MSSKSKIPGDEAKPTVGAKALWPLHPDALVQLSHQEMIVQKALFNMRTYEDHKCFFIVFKPYNKAYADDKEWFEFKGMDRIRKSINEQHYFITREVDSAKIHINMVVYSQKDLVSLLHEKSRLNKYFMSCSELKTKGDRERVVNYITKESTTRQFRKYLDYQIKI